MDVYDSLYRGIFDRRYGGIDRADRDRPITSRNIGAEGLTSHGTGEVGERCRAQDPPMPVDEARDAGAEP